VYIEGVIWEINSFDQWGVELGKQLANEIYPLLKMDPESDEAKKAVVRDTSTQNLIDMFREANPIKK
jgi:glucose-6-phosphate isomerase